jgi:signal transduction histidine kinase
VTELLIGIALGILLAGLAAIAASRIRSSRVVVPRDEPTSTMPARSAEELDRMTRMLNEMEEGVLFFGETSTLAFANSAARRALQDAGTSVGPVVRNTELMSLVRRAQSSGVEQDAAVTFWPGRQTMNVRVVPNADGEVIAVLRDIAEEERLTLVRRQFVVSASHEMKTPVTAMQALAEAGQQALDTSDLEAVGRFMSKLVDESTRLSRLVQDLLDLSRVEDPTHIARDPADLGAAVTEVVDEYRAAAEAKSVQLKASVGDDLIVHGDQSQLRLLVKNLVDNALRYTSADGSILVEVFRQDAEAVLRVADTGAGIPLSAQSRVFERFFRVDEARDRAHGGTGLGLSIVKHVVDLHGGRVSLDSELGEGSTFTVSLPIGGEGDG